MKKLLSLCLATLLFSSPALAEQASPESIKALMIKTGAGNMATQMMGQMVPALKQMAPNAPDAFWDKIMAEVDSNEVIDMTVPIYQKYLSQEDINALNEFYNSPAGQKMIQVQPKIMRESITVGQQWGQQVAKKVMAEYEAQR